MTWRGLTENKVAVACVAACVLLQLLFTHTAPMQALFGTTAFGYVEWIKAAGVGAVVLLVVEAEKAIRRRAGGSDRRGGTTTMSHLSSLRGRNG